MCEPLCPESDSLDDDTKRIQDLIHRFLRPRPRKVQIMTKESNIKQYTLFFKMKLIFPFIVYRRDPTFSIILGVLVLILIIFWVAFLGKEYLKIKFSYYKLILCNNQCCDDLDEESLADPSEFEDEEHHFRCFSRSGTIKDCLDSSPSPPPPYEPPPSYNVALIIEREQTSLV